MKILAVCAHGLGSSFIIEMNIKKALTNLGVNADVGHIDISSVNENSADIFVVSADLVNSLSISKNKLITLDNIISFKEIESKIKEYLDNQK